MVVHGLGNQGHPGHVAECSVEVPALVGFVELAARDAPSRHPAEKFADLFIGELSCRHFRTSLLIVPSGCRGGSSWRYRHYEGQREACAIELSRPGYPRLVVQILGDFEGIPCSPARAAASRCCFCCRASPGRRPKLPAFGCWHLPNTPASTSRSWTPPRSGSQSWPAKSTSRWTTWRTREGST